MCLLDSGSSGFNCVGNICLSCVHDYGCVGGQPLLVIGDALMSLVFILIYVDIVAVAVAVSLINYSFIT